MASAVHLNLNRSSSLVYRWWTRHVWCARLSNTAMCHSLLFSACCAAIGKEKERQGRNEIEMIILSKERRRTQRRAIDRDREREIRNCGDVRGRNLSRKEGRDNKM
jgi:hypothetical protein